MQPLLAGMRGWFPFEHDAAIIPLAIAGKEEYEGRARYPSSDQQ